MLASVRIDLFSNLLSSRIIDNSPDGANYPSRISDSESKCYPLTVSFTRVKNISRKYIQRISMKEFAHFKMIYFINSVRSIYNKWFKLNFSLIHCQIYPAFLHILLLLSLQLRSFPCNSVLLCMKLTKFCLIVTFDWNTEIPSNHWTDTTSVKQGCRHN